MPPKVNFNFYELDSDILDFLKKQGPLSFAVLENTTLSDAVSVDNSCLFTYTTTSADNHRRSLGEYTVILEQDLQATSTEMVVSTESIILPPGNYDIQGFFYATTNSVSAGIQSDIYCSNNPDVTSTIFAEAYMSSGFNESSLTTPVTYVVTEITNNKLVENFADISNSKSTIATSLRGSFIVNTPTQINFRVSQRNGQDPANPAIMRRNSKITFRRISATNVVEPSFSYVLLNGTDRLVLDNGDVVLISI